MFKNVLAEFKDFNEQNIVEIKNSGEYSICFVGTKYVKHHNSFKSELYNISNNVNFNFRKILFKPRLIYKNEIAIESYKVFIPTEGKYQLKLNGFENLKFYSSMLISERIFRNPINSSKVFILIKESINVKKILIGLFLIFISFALLYDVLFIVKDF